MDYIPIWCVTYRLWDIVLTICHNMNESRKQIQNVLFDFEKIPEPFCSSWKNCPKTSTEKKLKLQHQRHVYIIRGSVRF